MKRIIKIAIIIAVALSLVLTVSAHSGRTDASGGHRDNKNASGLGYYHYHCGGNPPHLHSNVVCPSSTSSSKSSSTTSGTSSASLAPAENTNSGATDAEKAAFLDKYIAIIVADSDYYHTIDCETYKNATSFSAYNVSKAVQLGYASCTQCH